jgi:O-acetyl-ADP-ribose deacetylase
MERLIGNLTIELKQGDITKQPDMEAIVNAANARLQTGGGVAGAIHRAGGSALEKETRPLAPISPGDAVITSAPGLPNRHIIHCLGPVYGQDEPSDKLLADCYRNAIKLADESELKSIAFPAISTGVFGYPVKDAAQVALGAIKELSGTLKHVKHVRFVLWSEQDFDVHIKVLEEISV